MTPHTNQNEQKLQLQSIINSNINSDLSINFDMNIKNTTDNHNKHLQQYHQALQNLVHSNQSMKILIKYCQQRLSKITISQISNIHDYSPVTISRLIFGKQLKQIKGQIDKLPKKQCLLEHFLLIMMKVMMKKLQFQNIPFYFLGFKQMFKQIKNHQNQDKITYQSLQNYILGQVVNFNNDQQNADTQFQIQFQQKKMQDFLIHDNGVKKIHYSNDLKKYIVLDNSSNIIKIYNQQMKIIARFQTNKQKHKKKRPQIVTFDFNQLGSKLAISQIDNTFSIINLRHFLQSTSDVTFRQNPLNQVVYNSESKIQKVYFLSMVNKWLTIDEKNMIYLWDVEKMKQQNQVCKTIIKHPNDDYPIVDVIELIQLSAVCFIVNHEIFFYSQTLAKKKFKKFSHHQVIKQVKYCEQNNQFYVVGKQQKSISIFTINKNNGQPKILKYFATTQIIVNFQVFPYLNSILVVDNKFDLKIFNQLTSVMQFHINYQYIVKKKNLPLNLIKMSKNEFIIHSTYILVMDLKKVAIQKDIVYQFVQGSFYYNKYKQQISFSMNNQVMTLALMYGQIRKCIANENSNLTKHKAIYMSKHTETFIIDANDRLFQIYNKVDPRYKQNKDYQKNSGITQMKKSFYDEQTRQIIMLNDSSIYIVRNDGGNNFTVKSSLLMTKMPIVTKWKYYKATKQLLFSDVNNNVYVMQTNTYEIKSINKLYFLKDQEDQKKASEKRKIQDFQYDPQFGILIVLNNRNQLFFIKTRNKNNIQQNKQDQCYFSLKDVLPYKLHQQAFTKIVYQKGRIIVNQDQNHSKQVHQKDRVFLLNQNGFMVEVQISLAIERLITKEQKCNLIKPKQFIFVKDTHQLDWSKIVSSQKNQFNLLKKYYINISKQLGFKYTYLKCHESQIVYIRRIHLQDYNLLTISQDGHLKLWGSLTHQPRKVYFDLKLPSLMKMQWNMNQIHQKRNQKNIKKALKFLAKYIHLIEQKQKKQKKSLSQGGKHVNKALTKNKSDKIKLNLQNPIKIQFENKQLQQFVVQQSNMSGIGSDNMLSFMTINDMNDSKIQRRMRHTLYMPTNQQKVQSPWKQKKQFLQLYQKAPSPQKYLHKYKQKMPYDLLVMRNDLQIQKPLKRFSHSKILQKDQKMLNLPQLKNLKLQSIFSQNFSSLQQSQLILPNPQQQVLKQQQQQQQQNILKDQKQSIKNKFDNHIIVKSSKQKKKANAFDQIDKYFNRKQQELLNKKWIPNKSNLRKQHRTLDLDGNVSSSKIDSINVGSFNHVFNNKNGKEMDDPLKNILKIFQEHNKQAISSKRGRLIRIPLLNQNAKKKKVQMK